MDQQIVIIFSLVSVESEAVLSLDVADWAVVAGELAPESD